MKTDACAGIQWKLSLCKKATMHQVTTMLATSKNLQFPGHNHLLTTGIDDLTLIITQVQASGG